MITLHIVEAYTLVRSAKYKLKYSTLCGKHRKVWNKVKHDKRVRAIEAGKPYKVCSKCAELKGQFYNTAVSLVTADQIEAIANAPYYATVQTVQTTGYLAYEDGWER